ncbi:MAG: FAD-binding oxidoreductase [SAR202 cluster bacterium]|nr:FAD-binding oxidoreductase [SAR202 cluster bacterium]
MNNTADVVVAGGGVMGCSILYNLASMGMRQALLLESGTLAGGSTGRSMAILRMHYSNEVTARMAWESLAVFRHFEEVTGGPSGYVRTGYLLVAQPEYGRALRENVAMQQRVGVDTAVVDADGMVPMASGWFTFSEGEACAYEPESGYADPYLVATGYARKAQEMGAAVRTGTPVGSIEVEDGKVAGVVTGDGRVATRTVVVATGVWSQPMLAALGVDVPLECVRHQVVTLRRPSEALPDHPTIGDVVNGLSARPDSAGLTLVGVGEEPVPSPDGYNQGVDWIAMEDSTKRLVARMPRLAGAYYRGGWSGLFDVTPDWHPVLGRVEGIEGLYLAVGFSGHGFKLSPMVGQTMAELIVKGETTIDVSILGLDRFRTGNLMRSKYPLAVLA